MRLVSNAKAGGDGVFFLYYLHAIVWEEYGYADYVQQGFHFFTMGKNMRTVSLALILKNTNFRYLVLVSDIFYYFGFAYKFA